jgi:hypothetical protein
MAFRRNILPPASPRPEDGGILFVSNNDMCQQNYMVSTQKTTILIIIAVKTSQLVISVYLVLPRQVYAYISAVLI